MKKEKVWVCVYRDTIEEHNESTNLSEILVMDPDVFTFEIFSKGF